MGARGGTSGARHGPSPGSYPAITPVTWNCGSSNSIWGATENGHSHGINEIEGNNFGKSSQICP